MENNTSLEIGNAIISFVAKVQEASDKATAESYDRHENAEALKELDPNGTDYRTTSGKKYIKVWADYRRGSGGSIFAFIDKATGDIFMPAGLQAPAKHARGNVLSEENGMEAVNVSSHCSIRYLK